MLEFLGEHVLSLFENTNTYLVFNDDGTEVLVAKTPVKLDYWWGLLRGVSLVYGNNILEIDDGYYTIGLLRGGNSHVTISNKYNGYNTIEHRGSEWDRYMYPIHSTIHLNTCIVNTIEMGTLAQYSDADLLVHINYGKGSYSWCQEVSGMDSTTRVLRGGHGVTGSSYGATYADVNGFGWRPILTKLNIGV